MLHLMKYIMLFYTVLWLPFFLCNTRQKDNASLKHIIYLYDVTLVVEITYVIELFTKVIDLALV